MNTTHWLERTATPFVWILVLTLACLLPACGGGGATGDGGLGTDDGGAGDDGGTPGPNTGDPQLDALIRLGVPTQKTARRDDQQNDLPDDYSPLGSTCVANRFDEMILLGMQRSGSDRAAIVELIAGQSGFTTSELFDPDATAAPWQSSSITAATAADIDGDGLEETIVAYRRSSESDVRFVIIDDKEAGFAISPSVFLEAANPKQLLVVPGDFNGDGRIDVVVAIVEATSARLYYLLNEQGTLEKSGTPKTFNQQVTGSDFFLAMEAGNLDHDMGYELAVVVNELHGSNVGDPVYFIYDDVARDCALLRTGPVVATVGGVVRQAVVADVGLGDIDGDAVDEVVLGGLTDRGNTSSAVSRGAFGYVVYALDDRPSAFAAMGAAWSPYNNTTGTPDGASGVNRRLNYAHVNTVDFDGDGRAEFHVNNVVFAQASGTVTEIHALDFADVMFPDRTGSFWFEWDTTTMAVGDVTGDEKQNLVTYTQTVWGATPDHAVYVWGDLQTDQLDVPVEMHRIPVVFQNSQTGQRPQIVMSNVDKDSAALRYAEGSYQLVFTEPVIVAVLAAPPCGTDLGQNADLCRTTFGTSTSSGHSLEEVRTVSAGVTVGFSAEAFGFGGEMIGSMRRSASASTARAYELTTETVFTTGPMEDSVIFTSIPMDQYSYTVLSHPEGALYEGKEVVVSMPRRPVQIMTTIEFFNANAAVGSPKIDASVLEHTPGVLSSYPSESRKNALLRNGGFEGPRATVDQGSGARTLSINVYQENSNSSSYGAEYELEVQATAFGVVTGFSVGYSSENTVQLVSGSATQYSGTVGAVTSSVASYDWGLFTYVHEATTSGQEFEVVNYWVRQN